MGEADGPRDASQGGLGPAVAALLAAVDARARAALAREDARPGAALLADSFDGPRADLSARLLETLDGAQVHAGHPRYFGFPRATPSAASAIGALYAAALNPELATRQHAPFAVAAEERLAAIFGDRLLPGAGAGGQFTSGASEGTLSALTAALADRFPRWAREGVAACTPPPRVYASVDAHPSLLKAVRSAGLGDRALRWISTDPSGGLDPLALGRALGEDRGAVTPLMVVATFGTTTTGALDPVGPIAELCRRHELWLHVDAAWGGLLALASAPPPEIAALASARSLVFDPPKVLPVPGGSGLLLLRDPAQLERALAVSARYLPRSRGEPFARSLSWSRGFRGLPLLFALAEEGFAGFARRIDGRLALAEHLRVALGREGFLLRSATPLPVVAFVDGRSPEGRSAAHLSALARAAKERAGAYLPLVRLPSGEPVLRAAVVGDRTTAADVDALVAALALPSDLR